jgi:lactoylglutathione lyase
LALGVDDIYMTCDDLRSRGATIVREPGPMAHGSTHIAFVEDPNGYKIELIDLNRRA